MLRMIYWRYGYVYLLITGKRIAKPNSYDPMSQVPSIGRGKPRWSADGQPALVPALIAGLHFAALRVCRYIAVDLTTLFDGNFMCIGWKLTLTFQVVDNWASSSSPHRPVQGLSRQSF